MSKQSIKLLITFILLIAVFLALYLISKNGDFPEPQMDAIDRITEELIIRTITAYTLSPEETDDSPCYGAFNDDLCKLKEEWRGTGWWICASNEFERGQKLVLHSREYGALINCVVMDRMNGRYKNRIDLLMDTKENAINFGIREFEIEVIN